MLPGYMLAGLRQARRPVDRGRDQVLPARLVLERDLPVRPGLRLGLHRHHAHRRAWPRTLQQVVTTGRCRAAGLAMGLALMTTGRGLQDRRGARSTTGRPTPTRARRRPVTGYLSVGPKVGAFALILRLFAEALGADRARTGSASSWCWPPLTMTLGNLVALTQDNIKRMLAYSLDRPHRLHPGRPGRLRRRAGGSTAASAGIAGMLFYSAAYTFMNLGAFAVVAALQRPARRHQPDRHVRRPGPARAPGWAR